ncbi:MAG: hypothetical protein JWN90_450 [Parcubacteria group bacterium]|nr:hypothetical protein [Parcubacteria group bacterium]
MVQTNMLFRVGRNQWEEMTMATTAVLVTTLSVGDNGGLWDGLRAFQQERGPSGIRITSNLGTESRKILPAKAEPHPRVHSDRA